MSPVSWSVAYEDNEARNGYSLTKGYFSQDSHVQFATGKCGYLYDIAIFAFRILV